MNTSQLVNALLATVLAVAATSVRAQAAEADKQAAMERYLRAVPMTKMMDDTYTQMAKQVPAELRPRFIADMRSVIRIDRIEQLARSAMLKTFTADELNALADFYSSKHGASAMSKFGVYMADIMPPLMQEIQRAVQELQSTGRK